MDGSNINGIELLVPNEFKAILPVSPYHEFFDYEHFSFLGLKLLVSPGDIVFDIGASYGVMSCLISKLCRGKGKVYAFEANNSVIEKAKQFANVNKISNIEYINKFAGDKSGATIDFFIVPGSRSVASTGNPEILKFHPDALRTKTEVIAIDDFVHKTGVIPQVCNIDVEGAEFVVVNGMEHMLSNHSVELIIETHSDEMLKIGGNLDILLQKLQKIGYLMIDLVTHAITDREEFLDQYRRTIGHILLSKKLKNQEFLKKIIDHASEEIISVPPLLDLTLNKIQKSIENNDCAKAKQLKELLKKLPNHPRMNYLYALSLHFQKNAKKALRHYNLALNYGYDEYWVKYNRSSLLADLGQIEAALADAETLQRLKPGQKDAIAILERIQSLRQR